jgi:hypothetical protein
MVVVVAVVVVVEQLLLFNKGSGLVASCWLDSLAQRCRVAVVCFICTLAAA